MILYLHFIVRILSYIQTLIIDPVSPYMISTSKNHLISPPAINTHPYLLDNKEYTSKWMEETIFVCLRKICKSYCLWIVSSSMKYYIWAIKISSNTKNFGNINVDHFPLPFPLHAFFIKMMIFSSRLNILRFCPQMSLWYS